MNKFKPWYMNSTDGLDAYEGNPERTRRHLEDMASLASAEADAQAAHLRTLEAKGMAISPSTRMAMGYAANARKAATMLGTASQEPQTSPEQRIARGYGA